MAPSEDSVVFVAKNLYVFPNVSQVVDTAWSVGHAT